MDKDTSLEAPSSQKINSSQKMSPSPKKSYESGPIYRPRFHLIAPGGRCNPDDLEKAVMVCAENNISICAQNDLLGDHPLYANEDQNRFNHLKETLHNVSFDESFSHEILWALRGGCGTSRMMFELDQLDDDLKTTHSKTSKTKTNTNAPSSKPIAPKTLIGFSDITAFLLYVTQKWGWKPIHGPVLNSLLTGSLSNDAEKALWKLVKTGRLNRTESVVLIPKSPGIQDTPVFDKTLSAPLIGGNLSLIQRSIGTPWQMDARGKIVFLEDINEPPYKVAELLDHLIHAGILAGAKAILLGGFTCDNESKNKADSVNQDDLYTLVFQEFSDRIKAPVFRGLKSGHMAENFPLQLGQEVIIESVIKSTVGSGQSRFRFKQSIHL